jgi:hypothetical protein
LNDSSVILFDVLGDRNSFHCGDSIFVLLFENEPCGTAFSVQCPSMNKLITAGHSVIENGQHLQGFSICLQSEWQNGECVHLPEVLEVNVVGFDEAADWAVLQISRPNFRFEVHDALEICPLRDIPAMKTESKYKIYHCPCELFLKGIFQSIQAEAIPWMMPCSLTLSQGEICFRLGLSKGSSGGCVVDKHGKVVAFHVSSTSTSLTMADAKKIKSPEMSDVMVATAATKSRRLSKADLAAARRKEREDRKEADEKEKKLFIDSVSEAIDAAANSHVSISTCVIISHHETLMACINDTIEDANRFVPITDGAEKASAV